MMVAWTGWWLWRWGEVLGFWKNMIRTELPANQLRSMKAGEDSAYSLDKMT